MGKLLIRTVLGVVLASSGMTGAHAGSSAPDGLRPTITPSVRLDPSGYQLRFTPAPAPAKAAPLGFRPAFDPAATGSIRKGALALRGPVHGVSLPARGIWENDPDLRGSLNSALLQSAALRAALSDVDVAQARVLGAMAAFMPNLVGDVTRSVTSASAARSPSNDQTAATLSLTMPLFTSGRNLNALMGAKATRRATSLDARAKADSVVFDVLSMQIEADFARLQLAIAEDNLATMRRLRISIASRMRAGFSSNADLADIDSSLAAAERQRQSAQGALASAMDRIRLATGSDKAAGVASLARLESLFSAGKDRVIRAALTGNNSIGAARERAQAAVFAKKAAIGKYLPRVDLSADYTRILDHNTTGSVDPNRFSIQVRLRVPLVDPATVAEIREARALAASAEYRAQDVAHSIETQVSGDWESYVSKSGELAAAARQVSASKRSLVSRQKQFEAGMINADSLATQAQNVADARLAEAQLKAEKLVLMARMAVVAGMLD